MAIYQANNRTNARANGYNQPRDIVGSERNDYLVGNGVFNGGKGNDTIIIDQRGVADTLIFNLGDGKDTIYSADMTPGGDKLDKIQFGQGITADMISYRREGNHLIVAVGDRGDQMTFTNYFNSPANQTFNRFEFADGTVWEDIRNRVFTHHYDNQSHSIEGTQWDDEIYAGSGNDYIYDVWGNNYIDAGAGDDVIIATGTVKGGAGNDTILMNMPGSADTLIFNLGDGKDTIQSRDTAAGFDKRDKIVFGAGITADMISYRRDGDNLVVVVGDRGDQMTFSNYFGSQYNQTFNRFEFADGTVWDDIRTQVFTQHYDNRSQNIQGTQWDDAIYAGSGNDYIYDIWGNNYIDAGAGNDVIIAAGTVKGGAGNDTINLRVAGSADTLLFNLGDGKDVINSHDATAGYDKRDKIVFGKDVTADMVSYRREGDSLIVVVGDRGDQMTFTNYFSSQYHQNFNRFEFADGTVWEDIRERVFTQHYDYDNNTHSITGTPWDDKIYGGAGSDVIFDIWGNNYIDAGAGNDLITATGTIKGGKGNDIITVNRDGSADTLLFGLGDGQDIIKSFDRSAGYDSRDKVVFGQGVKADMISYLRQDNDLIVKVGSNGDQMTFTNYFSQDNAQTFNRFEFADGTVWNDIRQTEQFKSMETITTQPPIPQDPICPPYPWWCRTSGALENQANNLVSSMATFSSESAGSSVLNSQSTEWNTNVLLAASVS